MTTFILKNVSEIELTDGTTTGADIYTIGGGVSVNGYINSTGVSAGTLKLEDQSISDTSGNISFNSSNLTSVGDIGCGAITSTGNMDISGTITGDTSLTLDTTTVTTAEIGVLDGVTAGTAAASKALVLDGNLDIGTLRNLTSNGTIQATTLQGSLEVNQLNSTSLGTSTVLFSDGTGGAAGVSGFELVAGTNMTNISIDSSAGQITFNASGGGGGGATSINGLNDASTDATSVTLGFEDGSLGTRSVLVGISPGFSSSQTDCVLIGYNPGLNGSLDEVIAIGTDVFNNNNLAHGQTVAIGTSVLSIASGAITNTTAIGHEAGSGVTTGGNNTFIGYQAGNTVTGGTNITCLGNGATASGSNATNEVTLGNGSVDTLRCASQTIASVSDARDKTDIEDLQYGLEFLDGIRPVEFTWDRRPLHPGDITNPTNGTRKAGFIAQELLEAMPNGENEILDLVTESNPERIEAKYASLIPVMVRAIKDLKREVQELRQRIDSM